MRLVRPSLLLAGLGLAAVAPLAAQAGSLAAVGAPKNPKVQVSWDRYYNDAGIADIAKRLEKAHPDYCRAGSIGKSLQGRDITLLTVSNFRKGDPDRKPAMYIDGNIHSNEIQGSEIALYTAWYLCEMAGQVPAVDSLLAERTFYIVPTINPDGRENFLDEPNNPHSPRSGLGARDNDGDGLVNEDGYDDLDGDGNITMMRRRNPNGQWLTSPEDPRIMIRALPDQKGEWDLLGYEGYDNDGDGLVNEDGEGYYDPNRNWPWRWQPQYVQGGSDAYPLSLPETRAVVDFITAHPNIAGAQSYHNNGGMILRGPGARQDAYRPQDERVYDQIGEVGEQILPGYKYMVVWKDLYIVWGGELDWIYGARGVVTFSNELWSDFGYFEKDSKRERYDQDQYKFDRLLLLGEAFVPWHKVQHPQYGEIEVGGFKKQYTRAIPAFLLPAEAHRNMAFTLYQARQMPLVRVDSVATRSLGGGLTEVTAIVTNDRIVPTHTQQDLEHRISRPDYVALTGRKVLAGFRVTNPLQDIAEEQKHHSERIEVDNIPGRSTVTVRWIVSGSGPMTITADSEKGGVDVWRGPA
ncbi:MAG TPA: M14 family metallopeptidase [Gemmatimonadales bacterium]|nr:M14 family metallopeptidase [Gemmatimonadales bacterium]